MKTYIVQYRMMRDGAPGRLIEIGRVKARSPAGALMQCLRAMTDISATLEIIATPEE